MAGLAKICKTYGEIKISSNGKTIKYVWDYVNDVAVPENEMTQERWAASEKVKWTKVKDGLKSTGDQVDKEA